MLRNDLKWKETIIELQYHHYVCKVEVYNTIKARNNPLINWT